MTLINDLLYELNEENMTATVFAPERDIKNVFIPHSVNYNSKKYVITGFNCESFNDKKSIESVEFAKDSEIAEFDKNFNFKNMVFSSETLTKFMVPPRVKNVYMFCKKLKTIDFPPDSELETFVLDKCNIDTINIPDSVTDFDFSGENLKKINFSKNSKMTKLKKEFFRICSIIDFEIPSNISEIEDEWNLSESLAHVTISPNNKNFILYDNKMILGKSHNNKDFDTIHFVYRDAVEVTIPSSVTKITPYAFAYCTKLKSIKIPSDSKLVTICSNAFKKTKISSLFIPSTVSDLQKEWCCDTDFLTHIDLSPNNKNFIYLDNKLLIGKSDSKKDIYDVILFANRDINHIFIPSSITKIERYSFQQCTKLKIIEFAQKSQLTDIENFAFCYVPVEKIIIPEHVKKIEYNAFSDCKNIQIIEFPMNSEIKEIQTYAFRGSRIEQMIIPISILKVVEDCYITIATLEIIGENIKFPDYFYRLLQGIGQISLPNASIIDFNKVYCNLPPLIMQKNTKLQGEDFYIKRLDICYLPYNLDSESINNLLTKKKELGSGATSVVYKVENFMTKKGFLALKVFKKEICKKKPNSKNVWDEEDDDDEDKNEDSQYDIEKMKNYNEEYKILSVLNHPNIIKAVGFFDGDKNNNPAILLEYCKFNLRDAIHYLEDFELICILYEICTSMKYIHARNIIHRDLKLENILINKDKHVKICDFGISTLIDSYTQTTYTHNIGTALFMAPELMKKNSNYDNKVDVYAFGVIMYFILTKGDFPDGEIGHLDKVIIPSSINELSRNIIKSCWAESPDDRPSFSDIIEEIERNKYNLVDGIDKMKRSIEEHLKIVDNRDSNCLLI